MEDSLKSVPSDGFAGSSTSNRGGGNGGGVQQTRGLDPGRCLRDVARGMAFGEKIRKKQEIECPFIKKGNNLNPTPYTLNPT